MVHFNTIKTLFINISTIRVRSFGITILVYGLLTSCGPTDEKTQGYSYYTYTPPEITYPYPPSPPAPAKEEESPSENDNYDKNSPLYPQVNLQRYSPVQTDEQDLEDAMKSDAQHSHYLIGRRRSKDLSLNKNPASFAQVLLIGNRHLSGDLTALDDENSDDSINKKKMHQYKENRIFEYNYDSVESPYNDSILLVEGSSYNTVSLENSEFFQKVQVIESEILTSSLFNVAKVTGWENSFVLAMNSILKDKFEEELIQNKSIEETSFLTQSFMINENFIKLQLRNYFMFQSIMKAITEYPNKRIIVTAGTCHFACEETIFDLLDSTNISYTTLEERTSLKEALAANKLTSSLSNLLYAGSKIKVTEKRAMTFRNEILKQMTNIAEKLPNSEASSEDFTHDARSFYESKGHILNFFRKEAYLTPQF